MTSLRTRERMIQRLAEQGIRHTGILERMRDTPRHLFLDEALAHKAYEDTALPIGYSQTLSQPYIVARMTECLLNAASSVEKVLEIGTGSGYQTAILAPFVKQLISVERIQPLQEKARERLWELGIYNVDMLMGDGNLGCSRQAPYNAILSAAAPEQVPESLKKQLAPDGVLLIPVGGDQQHLLLIKRIGISAEFTEQVIEPVKFVPLLKGVVR